MVEGIINMIKNSFAMLPEWSQGGESTQQLMEIYDALMNLYNDLKNIRYARTTEAHVELTFSSISNELHMTIQTSITGDLEMQMTKTMEAYSSWLIEHAELLNITQFEDVIELLGLFKYDPTTLEIDVQYPVGNCTKVHITGIKVALKENPSMTIEMVRDLLSQLIEDYPEMINAMNIAVTGAATSKEEVEIIIPEEYVQHVQQIERGYAIGCNLDVLRHMQLTVKPNRFGIADYKVIEMGRNIVVATNSTIVSYMFMEDEGNITLIVEGATGSIGALNITVPKAIMPEGSRITVRVDNQPVNATISEDKENYYVYVIYTHSRHKVEVLFSIPTSIQVSMPSQAEAGKPISIIATCLDQRGMPIKGIDVQLYANNELLDTRTTDVNGQASFTIQLSEGTYTIKLQANGLETTRTLTVVAPTISSWLIVVIAAVIVIVVIVGVAVALKRRR